MLLAITAQDGPTIDNLSVAGALAEKAEVALLAGDAIRENVLIALGQHPQVATFFMGHGQPSYLVGHDQQVSLSAAHSNLLTGRANFAYACHTGGAMGEAVAAAGGHWFGFWGPINCLPAEANVRDHYYRIIEYVFDHFPEQGDQLSAQVFINDLEALSAEAYQAIDASGTRTMDQFHTLRDLVYRLRIWIAGAQNPVKHHNAPEDVLFW